MFEKCENEGFQLVDEWYRFRIFVSPFFFSRSTARAFATAFQSWVCRKAEILRRNEAAISLAAEKIARKSETCGARQRRAKKIVLNGRHPEKQRCQKMYLKILKDRNLKEENAKQNRKA